MELRDLEIKTKEGRQKSTINRNVCRVTHCALTNVWKAHKNVYVKATAPSAGQNHCGTN